MKRLCSDQKCLTDVEVVEEHESAAKVVITLVQQHSINQEIKAIEMEESLPSSSPLFCLDPILSIFCVGRGLKY